MQTLEFGQERPRSGGMFLRVKEKGDSVTFRIGQNPVFTGKHFQQTSEGWDVTNCPRINENETCELCEKFFMIKSDQKKAKGIGDKDSEELLGKEARKYAVSVIYYFPILNRDTESFAILQTTEGVRNKINEQFIAGVKIFERDLTLVNTGSSSPKDRYALAVVDSSDSKPLTDKEKEVLKKASAYDTTTINDGVGGTDEISDMQVDEDDPPIVKEAEQIFNGKDGGLTDAQMEEIDKGGSK